jgi:tetratricopeptide (TPR) repeat protein
MGPVHKSRDFRHSWVPACLFWGVLLAAAPVLRAQANDQIDPFYRKLFAEGKILYDRGDFAAVVQNMEIAAFGLLDSPDRLLECYIYLELAHYGLKDESKAKIYDDKIRALNAPERIDSLKLPESVLSKLNNLRASFDRIAGRTVRPPLAKTTIPPPAKTEAAPPAKTRTTPPLKTRTEVTPATQAPTVPPDYLALARQQTNVDNKILYYKRAIQTDPNNIDVYFELDDAYDKANKYSDGAALMELFIKYYPENIPARLRLAKDWIAAKSFDKAVQSLTASFKMEPEHIEIRYLLGLAYIGQRKYKEALAEFDVVLARDLTYKDAEVLRKLCVDRLK